MQGHTNHPMPGSAEHKVIVVDSCDYLRFFTE